MQECQGKKAILPKEGVSGWGGSIPLCAVTQAIEVKRKKREREREEG